MSVSLDSLDIFKNNTVYETNNDKYALIENLEDIINTPEYKILGFQNNYIYSYSAGYLLKSTLDSVVISQLKLDIDCGIFFEKSKFMYFYNDTEIYQISESLEINWVYTFDDYIKYAAMDIYGSVYIIFKNSKSIQKLSADGKLILYIDGSNDPTKETKLHRIFISKGGRYVYILGIQYYNQCIESFIDKYDMKYCDRIEHSILSQDPSYSIYNDKYEYTKFLIKGDYIYIHSKYNIKKINLKMIPIWNYIFTNKLVELRYDNNTYDEFLYFHEDLSDTNGYNFGKITITGNLLWRIMVNNLSDNPKFSMVIYNNEIYQTLVKNISSIASYILALDNDNLLFESDTNGNLLKILEYNYEELFSSDNYFGYGLVGDKRKVPLMKEYALMHDDGFITVDMDPSTGKLNGYLLFDDKNNVPYNKDNYEFFQLISSNILLDEDIINIINTLNGPAIKTKTGELLKTKNAYVYDQNHQSLISLDRETLLSMDEEELLRLKYIKMQSNILQADRHKYMQNILTKENGIPIITKKKGYEILRKSKYIFRYILRKVTDTNIISEYLEQNGVLKTMLPEYVDKLRHHTTSMIQSIQVAGTPTYYDIQGTNTFNYTFDNVDYPIRTTNTQIYLCNNIPFDKKRFSTSIFIDSMSNLVANKEVRPFLLFVNGKAIKWSDMTIIRDWSYSYIMINNISTEDKNRNLECILFPCNIRYGEDTNIIPTNKKYLYFDKDGLYTDNVSDISIRIEITDKNVSSQTHILTEDNKYLKVDTKYNQLASEKNIFAFENGKLFGDSRFYLTSHNKNIFTYSRDLNNTIFKTFYYIPANDSKNVIFKLPNQQEVVREITEKSELRAVDNFKVPFDFSLSRNKTYSKNIADAVAYIMDYDMSLLINYYKDKSNIKSYTYSGQQIIDLAAKNGSFLVMPRQRTKYGLDDYILVFVNNQLYSYYNEIEYENRYFKIPIFNHIDDKDKVEIIHFKNVDNSYTTLTVNKDNDDYLSKHLRHNNFLLFGNAPSGSDEYPEFDVENNIQYDINFDYKNNFDENGKYKSTTIELDDLYYYNKIINITSKRQFHYMYYNVFLTKRSFNLNPEFRFCHMKNHYMVFVNGIKLRSDEWILNIMTNDNVIDYVNVTLTFDLYDGDKIEVVYLPDAYEEIFLTNNSKFKGYGDISMDIEALDYPFDKDLFFIFLDGKKINPEYIDNVSNTRIRINNNMQYSNICICRYLQSDEILRELFSYSDYWSRSIESLSEKEYEELITKIKRI